MADLSGHLNSAVQLRGYSSQPKQKAAVSSPGIVQRHVTLQGPPPAPRGVAQRMLVQVRTKPSGVGGARVISSMNFEGRVPTVVKDSQGDHTVAESLVELMIQRFCVGKTHLQVAQGIDTLLGQLDENAKTKYKNDDSKMVPIDLTAIIQQISAYQYAASNGVDGEDLNEMLDTLVESYIRVWNKRAGSAYLRALGKTTGNGKGEEEKQGKKILSQIGQQLDQGLELEDDYTSDMADGLVKMIDFVPKDSKRRRNEAARHIAVAVELALKALPETEFDYNDIATFLVERYADKHNLDEEAAEDLDTAVFKLLRGADNDMNDDGDL